MAANLASIATEEIQRGDVITTPGWLRSTKAVDVKLRVIKAAPKPLQQGDMLTFHTGAAESVAKLSLLDAERLEPGQTGWAQLRLADPVAIARGDLFVVRIPSPSFTVGGGTVVDTHPKRHRRFQQQVLQKLSTLERGSPEEIVLEQLSPAAPLDLQSLTLKTGLPQEQVREAVVTFISRELLLLETSRGRKTNHAEQSEPGHLHSSLEAEKPHQHAGFVPQGVSSGEECPGKRFAAKADWTLGLSVE